MKLPRFRIRTLMVAVAIIGVVLGAIGSVRIGESSSSGGATATAIAIDVVSLSVALASLALLVVLLRRK